MATSVSETWNSIDFGRPFGLPELGKLGQEGTEDILKDILEAHPALRSGFAGGTTGWGAGTYVSHAVTPVVSHAASNTIALVAGHAVGVKIGAAVGTYFCPVVGMSEC